MNMTRKLADVLVDYFDIWRSREFDWTSSTCINFTNNWVRLIEGRNVLSQTEPYTGMKGAIRLVLQYGSLDAAISKELGREPIDPKLAKLGDVVMFRDEPPLGVTGICNGRNAMVLTSDRGITTMAMAMATHAWSVG